MVINKTVENGATTLALEGRLDTTTAPELEAVTMQTIPETDVLVMDFAKLEYISSAGLRVILKAQKAMNAKGTLKIKNVNEGIMEVFEITGFLDILTIE
ncbi:MAG: STAS domain-containing protein [Oscillospiraceae bacterium]|nr:STAS domain-containing protein [Oscillospiraceae bacterium]